MNDEEVIARELKSTLKYSISNDLATIIRQLLDDIRRKSLQNAKYYTLLVVYRSAAHVTMHLLRKQFIGDT